MKPLKLALKGFLGITSGIGRDTVEVDFEKIPESARLVALVGPNGAGKSTIIDNAHPYRVMPSRSSTPTPTSFSFYDHVGPLGGEKLLRWEHEGVTYESVIKVKITGKTKKVEAYLFVADGDLQPYRTADGTVSDGKAEVYDACVADILGPPEVFFATAFSAQQKKSVTAMPASETKSLLSAMLGIDALRDIGTRAASVAKALSPQMDSLKAAEMQLRMVAAERESLGKQQAAAVSMVADLGSQLDAKTKDLAAVTEDLGRQRALQQQQVSLREQRDALKVQLDAVKSALKIACERIDREASQERAALATQVDDLSAQMTQCDLRIDAVAKRIETQTALVSQKDAITSAVKSLQLLRDQISSKRVRLEELDDALKPLQETREMVMQLSAAINEMTTEGKGLGEVIEQARKTAALTMEVPCAGTDLQHRCTLLGEAMQAKARVEPAEQRITVLRTKCGDAMKTRKERSSFLQKLEGLDAERKVVLQDYDKVLKEEASLRDIAARKPLLDSAEEEIKRLQQERAEHMQARVKLAERLTAVKASQAKVQQRVIDERLRCTAIATEDEKRLNALLQALPPAVEASALEALISRQAAISRDIEALQKRRDALRDEQTTISNKAEAIAAATQQAKALATVVQDLSDEIASWKLLAKAFSNDGVVALCIDDAGPAVSRLTNSLLDSCYGGRFQIRLLTQKESAAGTVRETFEVMVLDTQRGEEKPIDLMSGGEKVWVNECLVRALAIYIAQSGRRHFLTLFSDEADGPLDPERKRQYMAMKRAVLEQGGYSREYFITQTPELWEMADYTIDVKSL